MVIQQPIKEEKRAFKASVTQSTYTKRRASYRYINS